MRNIIIGTTFAATEELPTALGQIRLMPIDQSTELSADGRIKDFKFFGTNQDWKTGELYITDGFEINPYNFTYETRSYTGTDTYETITIAGIIPSEMPLDWGALEITAGTLYRPKVVDRPFPTSVRLPLLTFSTLTAANIKSLLERGLRQALYAEEYMEIDVNENGNAVDIVITAKKPVKLNVVFSGYLEQLYAMGTITVTKTPMSGFLRFLDLRTDIRLSEINDGRNTNLKWVRAYDLSNPMALFAAGLGTEVTYIKITTASFGQYPHIMGENNHAGVYQILLVPTSQAAAIITRLEEIKTVAKESGNNGIKLDAIRNLKEADEPTQINPTRLVVDPPQGNPVQPTKVEIVNEPNKEKEGEPNTNDNK